MTKPMRRCADCGIFTDDWFHDGFDEDTELIVCADCAIYRGDNSDLPFNDSQRCQMCGKDYGVRVYPDGKWYCTRCWYIWNH